MIERVFEKTIGLISFFNLFIWQYIYSVCWWLVLEQASGDWRRILQVTSVLHIATPLLAQYFPESPKWLLAKNDISKISELKTVLKYAAKVNGKYTEDSEKKIEALLVDKRDIPS